HQPPEGRRPFYKLRWRRGGRQHTRYLGHELARAEQVRAALERLQRPYRVARQLARLMGEARNRLREVKRLLEPRAQAQGFRYRGYRLQRVRSYPVGENRGATDAPGMEGLSVCASSINAKEGRPDEREERRGGAGGREPGPGAPERGTADG